MNVLCVSCIHVHTCKLCMVVTGFWNSGITSLMLMVGQITQDININSIQILEYNHWPYTKLQ